MLDIYRKYCRLFVEDSETRKEYQSLIESLEYLGESESTINAWADLIQLNADFGRIEDAYNLFDSVLTEAMQRPIKIFLRTKQDLTRNLRTFKDSMKKYKYGVNGLLSLTAPDDVENIQPKDRERRKRKHAEVIPPKPKLRFNYDAIPQRFSLPRTLMYYILRDLRHPLKTKLILSCKYFFARDSQVPCHRIQLSTALTTIVEHSLHLNKLHLSGERDLELFKNFYVTNSLSIAPPLEPTLNRRLLQRLLTHIYRFDGAFIKISNQDITWNDYCFLTESGRVQNLNLINTQVFKDQLNEAKVPLEDIILKIPNAFCIQ